MERTEWFLIALQSSEEVEVEESSRRGRVWLYEFGRSAGATYYVSPEGSDEAMGTESQPFGSFSHALSVMQAGDTLYVFDGVYTNSGWREDHGPNGDQNHTNPVLATLDFQGDSTRWTTIAAYPD